MERGRLLGALYSTGAGAARAMCLRALAFGFALSAGSASLHADIAVAGDRLTIRTPNVRVVMRGGEIVELTNRVTGEHVATGIGRIAPLTAALRVGNQATSLRYDGWRTAHEDDARRQAAQTVLRDGSTTVWLNVSVDEQTQDVVIASWGESLDAGLRGLQLGVRNLDLTRGRLLVPTHSGYEHSLATREQSRTIAYPREWTAQVLVWQAPEGGVVIYSRDDESRFKNLGITRRDERLDVALQTEAEAPWSKQTSIPHVEWRINAFKGDWRVPAQGYRALLGHVRPRSAPTEAQLWVGQIEAVETVTADMGKGELRALAQKRPPARTLLYLPVWGEGQGPDRKLTDREAALISEAHDLGFYMMLTVRVCHVEADWRGLERLARYRVRGNGATNAEGAQSGLIPMSPAAGQWRAAVIRGLKEAFTGAAPDALMLLDASEVWNDDVGRIDGRTPTEGVVTLLREIQKAFPGMVLGSDGMNELIWPEIRIAQRPVPADKHSASLTAAIFGPTVLWFGP